MFINKRAPPGDLRPSATRIKRSTPHRISVYSWLALLLLALFYAPSAAVSAKQISWHQYSESYEVHLGVVPAKVADRDTALKQMHEIVPHGSVERTNGLRHIMVSVFRRSGGGRISNVDISAEVIENDLIHVKRERKELDIMMLPSGVTYCNFFTLHWNGMYEIKLRILEPGKGTEWVTFYQEENALSN